MIHEANNNSLAVAVVSLDVDDNNVVAAAAFAVVDGSNPFVVAVVLAVAHRND